METTPTTLDEQLQQEYEQRYGWKFEGPFYTRVPTPRKAYLERCGKEIERLRSYLLETQIIHDQFDKDHSSRKIFWNQPEQREKGVSAWLSRKSKLRANVLIGRLMDMQMVIERVQKARPKLAENLYKLLSPEVCNNSERYKDMGFEEKAAYARQVDEIALNFLRMLAK